MVLMDGPPPLEDCSGFLRTLHPNKQPTDPVSRTSIKTTSTGKPRIKEDKTSLVDIGEDRSSLAVITSPPVPKAPTSSQSKPLKRGFFNSQSKDKSSVRKGKDNIPFITAKQTGSKVPEFLHVKAEDHPQEKLKKEVKDLLKPTEAIMNEVMNSSDIKAGLEDPEVMAAVQDIAANPRAIEKHKHNPKIVAFYRRMGKLMGDQIDKTLG